ncbi:cytosine permease [Kushneria phosphatilytica]|uniref:Cytosine permease n=1 Tax=Kushneria phosphatilytica TaxID=657387 RepID=A0A1S1NVG5_9GAMM|nr:cytosine permease [Kushneria phosphatilytica]OHV08876.1 cytosine permease [Kushneria phosphatilytica]QEL12597.1 cytosine permease [Kushneria phosphatilytica]
MALPHVDDDHPLSEVPATARKPFGSLALLLLGFTFFTATMFAGGRIGEAFGFGELLLLIVIGNLLLGAYAAIIAWMAARSGLNTALMARFALGNRGSALSDLLLGITQVGWYAWGVATIAHVLVGTFSLPDGLAPVLMVLFGFGFCLTAFVGYRGLARLSQLAVPAMTVLIVISMVLAWQDAGGLSGLTSRTAESSLGWTAGITIIFGTFVSGATQASNWSRFARTPAQAVTATLLAFFIGNGLMVLIGAMGAFVYQQPDIVEVLILQGLTLFGLIMLFLNLWTTQDNTIYNFAAAGCNLLRTRRRGQVTLAGAAVGTLLALAGMDQLLVPFLVALGTCIPPLGGVIIGDYLFRYRSRYPALESATLPAVHWPSIVAYVLATLGAWYSPWVPPLTGLLLAFVLTPLCNRLMTIPQRAIVS